MHPIFYADFGVFFFLILDEPESFWHFKSVVVMTALPTMRLTSECVFSGVPLVAPQSDKVNAQKISSMLPTHSWDTLWVPKTWPKGIIRINTSKKIIHCVINPSWIPYKVRLSRYQKRLFPVLLAELGGSQMVFRLQPTLLFEKRQINQ